MDVHGPLWLHQLLVNSVKCRSVESVKAADQGHLGSCALKTFSFWRHQMKKFFALLKVIHQSPVDSSNKGPVTGTFHVPLLLAWTKGWKTTRLTGNSRRHDGHSTPPQCLLRYRLLHILILNLPPEYQIKISRASKREPLIWPFQTADYFLHTHKWWL